MFVELWLVNIMFYLSVLGVIFQTIIAYKVGIWLGYNGTKLFFKIKDKYCG